MTAQSDSLRDLHRNLELVTDGQEIIDIVADLVVLEYQPLLHLVW